MKTLTYRKQEYLALLGLGFTNSEIAKILNVSIVTVKSSLFDIFNYLHAIDRTHAAFVATAMNLLTVDFCEQVLNDYPLALELIQQKKLQRELKKK